MVVRTGADECLAVGRGFSLEPIAGDGARIGIPTVDELSVENGDLRPCRRLNGDESLAGSAWMHPTRGHAATGWLPIAAEDESSGISRCVVYSF
ncbi:hypothetical protein GCM10010460_06470 [Microbacterium terrae]|uniref:DUF5597 domain-containing protein n=1 Tax=Microbacterium terrae TaxID=69369 RepID=UPI0005ED066F|nr:hypothetical protein GCM10017594_04050 [Microbacterium terrae]